MKFLVTRIGLICLLLCPRFTAEAFQTAPLASSGRGLVWTTTAVPLQRCSLIPNSCKTSAASTDLLATATPAATSTQLWMSMESSDSDDDNNNKQNSSRNPFRRIQRGVITRGRRIVTRYRKLSKRAKRIVMVQLIVVGILFGSVSRSVSRQRSAPPPIEIAYSSFLDLVEQQPQSASSNNNNNNNNNNNRNNKDVPILDQVRIGNDRISYRLYRQPNNDADGLGDRPDTLRAYTRKVPASPELLHALRDNKITFAALTQPRASAVATITRTLMIGFYFLILWRLYGTVARAGGGGGKNDTPGKLAQASDLPMATFDEIQGIDGAKTEVMELVDTLRNPEKYSILGARAPTGLLLEGPPGVGKTLLARATAASAGVPLLYCSGSDFVEMFVGRGAARVRKLFERATKLSPCLIFIDELDALGKSRDMFGGGGGGYARSNDEAEQTLNQLLSCMDGLDSSRRICVMAATNRKEVLDPALIRPGRFDRIVTLQLPDAAGREKILRVHCKKLPGFLEAQGVDPSRPGALGTGRKVDLGAIAAVTEGFSGAELEFLVNEAAIRAVRRVSAALRESASSTRDIVPHVEAADFEASLTNFYQTRRKVNGRPAEILKNLWK